MSWVDGCQSSRASGQNPHDSSVLERVEATLHPLAVVSRALLLQESSSCVGVAPVPSFAHFADKSSAGRRAWTGMCPAKLVRCLRSSSSRLCGMPRGPCLRIGRGHSRLPNQKLFSTRLRCWLCEMALDRGSVALCLLAPNFARSLDLQYVVAVLEC